MTFRVPMQSTIARVLLIGLVLSLLGVFLPATAQAQDVETTTTPAASEDAPVEEAPGEDVPVEEAPGEDVPVEEAPGEDVPVEEAPGDDVPVEDARVEEPPVEEVPVEDALVEAAQQAEAEQDVQPLGPLNGVFAPDTDPAYVDLVIGSLQGPEQARFNSAYHWDPLITALINGGANQGDSLELTWSIIPDGTPMPAAAVWDTTCNSNLIATFDAEFGAGQWQDEFQRVWDDWTDTTGNVYTPAVALNGTNTPIDDGAAWPSSPGVAGVRGDVRIGGCTIDGNSGTLAYNYYPVGSVAGDMKIDAVDSFYAFTSLSPGLHNVFSHEHGHGIGLNHVCPTNQTKLLEPYISTAYTGLQHDDIRGIHRGYGDRFEVINNPNDTSGSATLLSPVGGQIEEELSLDSTNDEDWFKFSGVVDGSLNVTVSPVGFNYLEAVVVNGSCSGVSGANLDSASIMDLSFQIRDDSGVLATINTTSAGATEALANFAITHSGTHYIRVMGTGTDDTQLYDLSVELGDAPEPSVCPAEMLLGDVGWGIVARDTATGTGYLMWSAQDVHDRFADAPRIESADHVIAVVYNNGWFYDNDVALQPFTPADDDCLIVQVDFSADTATVLLGSSAVINGIDSGYLTGDLAAIANQWNGGFNEGEFTVTGTIVGEDVTPVVPTQECPAEMPLGDIGNGAVARDSATGTGYLMWSAEDVHTRFSSPPQSLAGDHLIVVVYDDGWFYDNDSTLRAFTPETDDCLVADLNFSTDTAVVLRDTSGVINGIDSGYETGDLVVIANEWGGSFNNGEFGVAGTIIGEDVTPAFPPAPPVPECPAEMPLGDIGNGAVARDSATGTGYLMWSAEDVHTRFSSPPQVLAGDHLIVVVYAGGWYYDNDSMLRSFTPEPDDCLVAALDFSADTAVVLQGSSGLIDGIDSGYETGDLVVTANEWGGSFNNGEFGIAGTIIGDDVAPDPVAACPAEMPLGDLGLGVLAADERTGSGYLMWSAEDVHTRFSPAPVETTADHLVAVVYDGGWFFDRDEAGLVPFVPVLDDCLIAALDFDADTAVVLRDSSGLIEGIDSGYLTGDLVVTADEWNGTFDDGEFGIAGTIIGDDVTPAFPPVAPVAECPAEMPLGDLGLGVLSRDDLTGTGYLMWSAEDVHTRLSPSPSVYNADHLVAVMYDNGWFYARNDAALSPFVPALDDCLIAALDFDADTAVVLRDSSGLIEGIDSGYLTGDLVVTANEWNGVINDGEFGIAGTIIGDDVTPAFPPVAPDPECPAEMPLGDLRLGVLSRDDLTGAGYLMWSAEDVHTRLSPSPSVYNADHLVAVMYDNGWFYARNDAALSPFVPALDDCLIAALDFDADTAVVLRDSSGLIEGIDSGYLTGDLVVTANEWNGVINDGEFGIAGTIIGDDVTPAFPPVVPVAECPAEMLLGDIGLGVLARDDRTGTGYMMWSAEDVHTRFSPAPNAMNADHLVAVVYDGGWFFDRNEAGLEPFAPEPTDCLVAALDFGAGTASMLRGSTGLIEGIDSGYETGDLVVMADEWNGSFNDGEFGVAGTIIGDDVTPAFPPVAPEAVCPEEMPLGDIGLGVLAGDDRTGTGYLMWSAEDVHIRFSPAPSTYNADHLVAVVYDDGWFFDRNEAGLVAFVPETDDCLIAALDFGAGTATVLIGTSGVINGIDSGYEVGDLVVTANEWNGVFNDGEFGIAGTNVGSDGSQ